MLFGDINCSLRNKFARKYFIDVFCKMTFTSFLNFYHGFENKYHALFIITAPVLPCIIFILYTRYTTTCCVIFHLTSSRNLAGCVPINQKTDFITNTSFAFAIYNKYVHLLPEICVIRHFFFCDIEKIVFDRYSTYYFVLIFFFCKKNVLIAITDKRKSSYQMIDLLAQGGL